VANIVSDISSASQEQARGLIEINGAVGQVDTMTQRNAAMVEEVTLVARDVAEQARHLTSVVETFVIDDSAALSVQPSQGAQATPTATIDEPQQPQQRPHRNVA